MSVGPYCDLVQDVDSANWTQGAVVSLVMDENEREFDRCPMYFNDGSNPWETEENHIRVFDFSQHSHGRQLLPTSLILITILTLVSKLL